MHTCMLEGELRIISTIFLEQVGREEKEQQAAK